MAPHQCYNETMLNKMMLLADLVYSVLLWVEEGFLPAER